MKIVHTRQKREHLFPSCEEAARWILGDPAGENDGDEERTELAAALGRVCDLLGDSHFDQHKIAKALFGSEGSASE